jgi:hypothetical protein
MTKYYIRGLTKISMGRAKELTPKELRTMRKTFPSLKFIKSRPRRK